MTQAQQQVLLDRFGRDVRDDAARSITLLREIEEAVDSLTLLTRKLDADTEFASSTIDRILVKGPYPQPIDPDGKVGETLLSAQNSLTPLYDLLVEKRKYASEAPELTADDGVEEAYAKAIASAADLHNALNQLRTVIGEHDADLDTLQGEHFETVDSLVEALRK